MNSDNDSIGVNRDSNIHWIEKYRPKRLEELISHENIIKTMSKFMAENRLPHLLLYGPPGTGKTSTILACAQQLYSPQQMSSMVLELNASDDRGIGIVRGPILQFASTKPVFKAGFKLIILDEADQMTQDAQNALRRIIEKFTVNTRFCLICNYLSKIIPALQSRCTRFRFGPLKASQIKPRIEYVIKQEKVKATEDGIKALIDLSQGDMRKVLNILQSTASAFDVVNEKNVYLCCGHPQKQDIENILSWLLNKKFSSIFENITKLKLDKGLALQDILTHLHPFIHKIDFPIHIKIEILDKMANIEYQLSSGSNEKLQLAALIAAFQSARNFSTEKTQ